MFYLSYPIPYTHRFEGRTGNRQSQLLQEVKGVLATTFTTTSLKGDGPVVKVPFTSYNVELIPAFSLTNGQYWVCMTDSGGYYKNADYDAESRRVKASNDSTKSNTRRADSHDEAVAGVLLRAN